jgi:hypothetical protein
VSLGPAELVTRLGGAPHSRLGIDLGDGLDDRALGRWLVAACLIGGRGDEESAERAFRTLDAQALAEPAALAQASPLAVAQALVASGLRGGDIEAMKLVRASRTLARAHAGSLAALAAEAEDLEGLAGRLAGLCPGIGRATLTVFLRPLRGLWRNADEVPLGRAARAAAVDLGWLAPDEDEDGPPGALRAFLDKAEGSPPLADVESALARLGRRACQQRRPELCLLGADCPVR